ncbi:M15 family metallopeptidase [Nonomuraea salmonea]|uniref:M15 family metallopeptidase n=1 Tax=Nonomuraea salmonea TaxID=46181 RepID=UPI002FE813D0
MTLSYWGFDGKPHTGELVVRKTVTDDIETVFKKLYDRRWPIRQMKLVDAYKADDYDSIDADNTSAFNCRRATGSSNWSNHAYGEAIDVNPLENPYVTASGGTAHRNAKKFTKRPMKGKGVINPGDRVVKTFAQVGWEWGGYWSGRQGLPALLQGRRLRGFPHDGEGRRRLDRMRPRPSALGRPRRVRAPGRAPRRSRHPVRAPAEALAALPPRRHLGVARRRPRQP